MKLFWSELPIINQQVKSASRVILFLDFDGTLSPIVDHWYDAELPKPTKDLLLELESHSRIEICIISGRSLENIQELIGISTINYAGNHGLEWEVAGKRRRYPLSRSYFLALRDIRKKLVKLTQLYEGTNLQDKSLTLSLHYRLLPKSDLAAFINDFTQVTNSLDSQIITVLPGKKVFDLCPTVVWTKGHACQQILTEIEREVSNSVISIYVGDDVTDEYAFELLSNSITVKVGDTIASRARYYLRKQTEVDLLLHWLQTISHRNSN